MRLHWEGELCGVDRYTASLISMAWMQTSLESMLCTSGNRDLLCAKAFRCALDCKPLIMLAYAKIRRKICSMR